MKLTDSREAKLGKVAFIWHTFDMDELKTEQSCLQFVERLCKVGKVVTVECRGPHDMDTHENYAFFHSAEEFHNGLGSLKKIEVDTIRVTTDISGNRVTAEFYPIGDDDGGTKMFVSGRDGGAVKQLEKAAEKLLQGM